MAHPDPREFDTVHSERIRQRPIDIEKKIPFFWLADEADDDSDTAAYRRDKGRDHDQDDESAESNHHHHRPRSRRTIPIPHITTIREHDELRGDFSRPKEYIRFKDRSFSEWDSRVEYEMEEDDEKFLEELRKQHKLSQAVLSEDRFETIIDRLEKDAFKRGSKRLATETTHANTDDVPCGVCNERDYEDKNKIVFCDGCNVAVHQLCYGIPNVPKGSWYCARCSAPNPNAVKCELCPVETGAFKPTTDGKWAHLACAIWIPGTQVVDVRRMEPITGLEHVRPDLFNLVCSLCGYKSGACITCRAKGGCSSAFHVTCAQANNLYMDIRQRSDDHNHHASRGTASVAENPEPIMTALCRKHSDQRFEEELRKKIRDGTFLEEAVKTTGASNSKRAQLPGPVMIAIFEYWLAKRNKFGNKPLLERLRLISEESAHAVIPISSSMKAYLNSNQGFMQMVHMRQEMEKARMISDMLKKREYVKRELVQVIRAAFESQYREITGTEAEAEEEEQSDDLQNGRGLLPPPRRRAVAPPPIITNAEDLSTEDLQSIKKVIELCIQAVGRESEELPKHDKVSNRVSKKEYKRAVKLLKDMDRILYLAGGSGGGSRYILSHAASLHSLELSFQRLLNQRVTTPRRKKDDENESASPQRGRSRSPSPTPAPAAASSSSASHKRSPKSPKKSPKKSPNSVAALTSDRSSHKKKIPSVSPAHKRAPARSPARTPNNRSAVVSSSRSSSRFHTPATSSSTRGLHSPSSSSRGSSSTKRKSSSVSRDTPLSKKRSQSRSRSGVR